MNLREKRVEWVNETQEVGNDVGGGSNFSKYVKIHHLLYIHDEYSIAVKFT